MTELPICVKLTRPYTRIPGTGTRLINPDGPEAAAVIGELVEALEKAHDALHEAPELNMSNFDVDDVAALNSGATEAFLILDAALAHARGETR